MSIIENEKITITRKTGGTYTNGHRDNTSQVSTDIKAKASIQELTGAEILQLPESDRRRHTLYFYSTTEIKGNDIILRESKGKKYEILAAQDWSDFDIGYYRARGMLLDE